MARLDFDRRDTMKIGLLHKWITLRKYRALSACKMSGRVNNISIGIPVHNQFVVCVKSLTGCSKLDVYDKRGFFVFNK